MSPDDDAAGPLVELLTNPDAFFRRRAAAPSLRGPVIVVFLVALVGIAGSLPLLRATTAALPAGAGPVGAILIASSVIGGVVGVLVAWVGYAAAFHVISAVAFGADSSFRTTVTLTGWGFVPRILEGVIASGLAYIVFSGQSFPSDPLAAQRLVRTLQTDPLFVLAGWLSVVFLLWSAMLWTFAMRHGRDLTIKQAGITVAVPVAVRLSISVLSLLGVLSGLFGIPG